MTLPALALADPDTPAAEPLPGRSGVGRSVAAAIVRRLIGAVVVLWAAATVAFLALQLAPGDTASLILGTQSRSPEALAAVTAQWGLDRPVWQQYVDYVLGALHGDFGTSYVLHRPVADVILGQLGPTILLALSGMLVALVLAVVVAVGTARRRTARRIAGGVELVLVSMPEFWLALMLLAVFSFGLGWFPVAGGGDLRALVLPALALGLGLFGLLSQVLRDALERTLEQPYATTVRSRGVGELALRVRHGLRHAALPLTTLAGYLVGVLIGGAVVIEQVFGRPGLGQLVLSAVSSKDLPLVLGVALVGAFAYVLATTAVDVLALVIDPRLRTRSGGLS